MRFFVSIVIFILSSFLIGCVSNPNNLTEVEQKEAVKLYAPDADGMVVWSDDNFFMKTGKVSIRIFGGILFLGLTEFGHGIQMNQAFSKYFTLKQERAYDKYLQSFVGCTQQRVLEEIGVPDRKYVEEDNTVWIYENVERLPTTFNSISFGNAYANAYGNGNYANAIGTSVGNTRGSINYGATLIHRLEFLINVDKKCINVRRRQLSR